MDHPDDFITLLHAIHKLIFEDFVHCCLPETRNPNKGKDAKTLWNILFASNSMASVRFLICIGQMKWIVLGCDRETKPFGTRYLHIFAKTSAERR